MNQPYVFSNGDFTWHVMISPPEYSDPLRHPTAEEARELTQYFASPASRNSAGFLLDPAGHEFDSIDGDVVLIPI